MRDRVNLGGLVKRLIEIEKALTVQDTSTVLRMVWDAQECALQIQKRALEIDRMAGESNVPHEAPFAK